MIGLNMSRDHWEYSPIFETTYVAKKIWKIINTIATIWGEKLNILVLWHYLFLKAASYTLVKLSASQNRECLPDKYLSIFLRQLEAIIYLLTNNKGITVRISTWGLESMDRAARYTCTKKSKGQYSTSQVPSKLAQ